MRTSRPNVTARPRRGEVWRAELDPVRGHEQSGTRPVLIVSEDAFNTSGAGMCVALPISSQEKRVPWHVAIAPPEGGLSLPSWIRCEDVRGLSVERLQGRIGRIEDATLADVEFRLRVLLKL